MTFAPATPLWFAANEWRLMWRDAVAMMTGGYRTRRVALIDGPSVVGWARWREVCQRHVFGLVEAVLAQGMEMGRIRSQPVRPLAHVLMGASDEAALYVAEAPDQERARAEMTEVLNQLIDGIAA